MDVSEEERLLRAAALNSRRLQALQLLPTGPAGNSLSTAPGGPSLSATGTPAGAPAGAPTGALAPPAPPAPLAPPVTQTDELVKIILSQQRQLEQAGVRPRAQPAPGFQVFSHQVLPTEAQQVATSASLRLGAQLAQLQLGQEQSEVSVLRANQLVMQANLLDHNRQQQRAAAEKKVGHSVSKLSPVSEFFLKFSMAEFVTALAHPTFCCVVSMCGVL